MMSLFKVDSAGVVVSSLTAVATVAQQADRYPDYQEGTVPIGATHFRNGEFLFKPARPSPAHVWNDAMFEWQFDLVAAKEQARARINAAREGAKTLGFPAYGKVFDSDAASRENMLIAVSAAQVVGEAWSVVWTTADNSTITLDYAQTLGLPVLMAQYGDELHQRARLRKASIDAATTQAEIDEVVW